jgi:hypothetical protein
MLSTVSSSELSNVSLDHDVKINDSEYITKEKTFINLKSTVDVNSEYVVCDENNNDLFYCTKENIIKDSNGNHLLNFKIKENFILKNNTTLLICTGGENGKEEKIEFIGRYFSKTLKYYIECNNQNGKKEVLDVIYDDSKNLTIYYGKKKEGGIPICKIQKKNTFKNACKIDIAKGVDKLFLTVIILCIFNLKQSTNELGFLSAILFF